MENNKVTVGIVTFNRKEYLIKELDAIVSGSVKPQNILIIENFSSDGTCNCFDIDENKFNALQKTNYKGVELFYYRINENKGGSFGFKKIFELFKDSFSTNYLWVMDDDVLPDKYCLEKLLENSKNNKYVICPTRFGENFIETYITEYKFKNIIGLKQKHRVKLTRYNDLIKEIFTVFFPFEGPFFPREIVETVGLPNDAYFFQYDDGDYSIRCSKVTKIKYTTEAILNRQIPISKEQIYNPTKFYYTIRNQTVFNKYYCSKIVYRFRLLFARLYYCIGNILRFNFKKYKIASKALSDAAHNRLGKRA